MTDMRGRRTRTEAPGVDPAGVDPASVKMRRRVGGEMPATHTHRAAAEMGRAATHTHCAATSAAKMSAAAPTAEVRTTTPAAEVSAAAPAAPTTDVTTATAAAAKTASRVSIRCQTQGKAYCGRACCDFPHDVTSSSGPNARVNARSPGTVPADSKL
jgi:hypothetical protein